MGQKTNPNIFRLGKTKTWNLQYFEKKSNETSIYTFQILEIKKFIHKFFKDHGLIVHSCEIQYLNENSLNICIFYYLTFNSLNIVSSINRIQNIKFDKKIDLTENKTNTHNYKKFKDEPNKLLSFINKFKTKVKKNKYFFIKQKIKNYTNYQISKTINNLQKDKVLNNPTINLKKNLLKINRLNYLKLYKKYLLIKKYKNFNRIEKNKILIKFLESLHLFINKKTNIFLTFQQLNKNSKQLFNSENIEILKKKIVILKKYEQNSFFKEGLNTLFTCTTQKNSPELLAEFIAFQLKKLKRHNFFLRFIKTSLLIFITDKRSTSLIKGIKIKIKGRLNGVPRAKHKIINIGKGVPNLTINSNINYAEKTSYTSNGTLGIKIWTYENKI
jgi:ribosomal protein S3